MSTNDHKTILAIDLGTSSVKSALISVTGEVAGWESEPIPLHVLPEGGAEQDPDDWWAAILKTSGRLLARGLVRSEEIVAVCASTQGEGTIPVDREGNPLSRCITWLDARGAKYVGEVAGGVLEVQGYALAKLLRWLRINGGAPARSGKDPFGHLLFIVRERPDVARAAHKFLNVLDWINYRLTGEMVATPDSVLGLWATDTRNPWSIRFHEGLVRLLPIAPQQLPPLRRNCDVIGPLRREVADQLGLRREVQVVAGAIDFTAAAVGSGAVADYQAHLSIGTSSLLGAHLPTKKTDLTHYLASIPCAIPGRYLVVATQDTAGGSLVFLRDKLFFADDGLLPASDPAGYFEALNELAARVPPGSHGLIFTPWLFGERCPVDDPYIRGAIHNLSLENTRADLVRAALEGVALNTRWMLGPAEKFIGGRKTDPINMIGGGARSDLWCQMHADVLDRTIRQVVEPQMGNARGAAFIAAVGLGYIRFEDIPSLVRFRNVYQPDPENRRIYDELFREFVNLYRSNRGIYERLNRPIGKK